MYSRIFFAAIVGFWLLMNGLLWRSQSKTGSRLGSSIPVQVVWDKILTAPDDSSLDIYDHDKKIGYCHWVATVGSAAQALSQRLADDYEPEGVTPQPTGYGLNLDGNTAIFGTNRVRFDVHLRLSTNQTWQDFRLTAKMRPTAVDIHAVAAAQKMMIKVNGLDSSWQKTLKFSDFQHPETLLADMGGDGLLGFAAAANLSLQQESLARAASGLKWDAHEDWMQFGHNKVPVYRLETEFFGQHIDIFTSRVGEILWVEAPNNLTLRNETFNHF
jgi:hypothetical protein